tara:strand:- start:638 stop:868 length:231 start_codon:yes stop_codon:yes gene_type:complete
LFLQGEGVFALSPCFILENIKMAGIETVTLTKGSESVVVDKGGNAEEEYRGRGYSAEGETKPKAKAKAKAKVKVEK